MGNERLIPETVPEQFNGVLRAWNNQNDTLGGLYPGIQSLGHYQSQFYAHILSLNVTNEHDVYTVSGLNCSATPISILPLQQIQTDKQLQMVIFGQIIILMLLL